MTKLTAAEFDEEFDKLFKGLKKTFFKLETLPTYDEYDIVDWNSLPAIKIHNIVLKAQTILNDQKDEDKQLLDQGITLKRVRVLNYPLDKYCLRQFSSYRISQDNGEKIYVFDADLIYATKYPVLNTDFVMFDDENVLVYEFDKHEFIGGQLISEINEVNLYKEAATWIEKSSIPFNQYLKYMNLEIPKMI